MKSIPLFEVPISVMYITTVAQNFAIQIFILTSADRDNHWRKKQGGWGGGGGGGGGGGAVVPPSFHTSGRSPRFYCKLKFILLGFVMKFCE